MKTHELFEKYTIEERQKVDDDFGKRLEEMFKEYHPRKTIITNDDLIEYLQEYVANKKGSAN